MEPIPIDDIEQFVVSANVLRSPIPNHDEVNNWHRVELERSPVAQEMLEALGLTVATLQVLDSQIWAILVKNLLE